MYVYQTIHIYIYCYILYITLYIYENIQPSIIMYFVFASFPKASFPKTKPVKILTPFRRASEHPRAPWGRCFAKTAAMHRRSDHFSVWWALQPNLAVRTFQHRMSSKAGSENIQLGLDQSPQKTAPKNAGQKPVVDSEPGKFLKQAAVVVLKNRGLGPKRHDLSPEIPKNTTSIGEAFPTASRRLPAI